MNINDLLKNYIPNPYSNKTTIPGLIKQSSVVIETFRFVGIIKKILLLFVIAFVLISFFEAPADIISILIGFEILSSLLLAFIKYQKIKKLSLISNKGDGINLKKVIVTGGYYALLAAIVGLFISSVSLGLILLFFGQQLSNFFIQNSAIKFLDIRYFVFLFVIFRFFDLLVNITKYLIIKKTKDEENIAIVSQTFSLINKKIEVITFVPQAIVILLVLLMIGLPVEIVLIFFGFFVLMIVLSIVEIKRIGSVDLSAHTPPEKIKIITLNPEEKIVGAIFGIMNLKSTAITILGVGKTKKAENTLLITDSRLLFIQFPVSGDDKIIGNMDYSDMNFFWNRGEIKEMGLQKINSISLEEIVEQYGINGILFSEITKLILDKMEFSVLTNTNEKYRYIFMDKDYIEPLKQYFSIYLKDKFAEIE